MIGMGTVTTIINKEQVVDRIYEKHLSSNLAHNASLRNVLNFQKQLSVFSSRSPVSTV